MSMDIDRDTLNGAASALGRSIVAALFGKNSKAIAGRREGCDDSQVDRVARVLGSSIGKAMKAKRGPAEVRWVSLTSKQGQRIRVRVSSVQGYEVDDPQDDEPTCVHLHGRALYVTETPEEIDALLGVEG